MYLWAAAAIGYVWFIVEDSALRGRSGFGWLLACLMLAPIGLPAFLVLSVRDRIQGRRGIERYWAPGVRWCYFVALGLAAVALALAAVQLKVTGPNVSLTSSNQAGFSRPASGSCDASPLGVLLGKRPGILMFSAGRPATEQAELERFAQRCVASAGRRMVASETSLAGGLALALIGGINQRRRRPVPPSPTPVSLAA